MTLLRVKHGDAEEEVTVEPSGSKTQFIEDILRGIKVQGWPEAYDIYLCSKKEPTLLGDDTPLESIRDGTAIELRVRPGDDVQAALRRLTVDTGDQKTTCFVLQKKLVSAEFAEEFIDEGGLKVLLDVIVTSSGNLLSYALKALRFGINYVSGIEFLSESSDLILRVFRLLESENITASRNAVEVLIVLCEFSENGFELIRKAAKLAAREDGQPVYTTLVNLLYSPDSITVVNVVTLLTSMLRNAPTKRKEQKFVYYLRKVEVDKALKTLDELEDTTLRSQLALFQEMQSITIPRSWYEVDSLRTRLQDLQAQYDRVEENLTMYEHQQPLIDLMRKEITRYHKMAHEAIPTHHVAFRSPFYRAQDFGGLVDELARERAGKRPSSSAAKGERTTKDVIDLSEISVMHPPRVTMTETEEHIESLRVEKEELEKSVLALSQKHTAEESTLAQLEAKKAELEKALKELEENKSKLASAALAPPSTAAAPPARPKSAAMNPVRLSTGAPAPPPMSAAPPVPPPLPMPGVSNVPPPLPMPGTGGPPPPPPMPGAGGAPPPPPMPGMGGAPPPPPMPGMGGAPPPPPPPGMGGPAGVPMMMMGAARPTKPVVKPREKMKNLHWKRIIRPPKEVKDRVKTVWDNVIEVTLDPDDLEKRFAKKVVEVKRTDREKPRVNSVLDSKRSNAIGIMLSRLPPFSVVKEAILGFDDSKLTKEDVEAVLLNLPTAEEIKQITDSKDPDVEYDRPEKFCLIINSIPKVQARLQLWKFMLEFPENSEDAEGPMTAVHNAVKEVRRSGSFLTVLGVILGAGNYLNGSTPKGQADGFEIDILGRLHDTKANDGTSLLDFIVQAALKKEPSVKNLPNELPNVKKAASHDLDDLGGRVQKLLSGVKSASSQMSAVLSFEEANASHAAFEKRVKSFLEEAEKRAEKLGAWMERIREDFSELLVYLGYRKMDADKKKSTEFFDLITKFVNNYASCLPKEEKKEGRKGRQSKRNMGRKIAEGVKDGEDPLLAVIDSIRKGGFKVKGGAAKGRRPVPSTRDAPAQAKSAASASVQSNKPPPSPFEV